MDVKVFEHGSTAIPNALYDAVMPNVSGNAWKALCLVFRQTAGWNRKKVGLSYRDLIKGMGVKSRATVALALKELEPLNLIIARHAEKWEETQFSLNYDAEISWTPVNFGASAPVPVSVPVPEIVTENPVPVSVTGASVPETVTGASVPETVTPPVPVSVLINRKDIKSQNKDIMARARAGDGDGAWSPPFASESPEPRITTSGDQKPQIDPGAPPPPPPPARTPVTIYTQISKRQLAIAEVELIESRVPQDECDQFERFLTGWAATYGTKVVFKVLDVYDKQKPKQQHVGCIGRPWTDEERAAYHADMRRLAETRRANKTVANSRKHFHHPVATGEPAGRDGRLADSVQTHPRRQLGPCLPLGALIEAKERAQQTLDSRRPSVRVEETQSGDDLECPF